MTRVDWVWFTVDRNGRKRAYRWSPLQFRAFPMPLADAELAVATGAAEDIGGHPLRGPRRGERTLDTTPA